MEPDHNHPPEENHNKANSAETPSNMVTSETFFRYLLDLLPRKVQFAPALTIPLMPVLYKYMADVRKEVYVDEESFADWKGEAERAAFLYYDLIKQDIGFTEVVTSEFDALDFDLLELMPHDRVIVIMEAHTHSTDSLQSVWDFQSLVVPSINIREVPAKAVVVFCKRSQLLALASPDTPKMTAQEFEEYARPLEESMKLDTELIELARLRKLLFKKWEDDLQAKAYELWENHDPITAKAKAEQYAKGRMRQYLFQHRHLAKRILDADQRLLNDLSMTAARELNLVLYRATDKLNFQRFE